MRAMNNKTNNNFKNDDVCVEPVWSENQYIWCTIFPQNRYQLGPVSALVILSPVLKLAPDLLQVQACVRASNAIACI